MKSYRKALFNLEYLLSQFPSSSKVNFLVGQVLEDFVKKISLEADGLDFITAENAILKNFDEPMEYYLKAFEFNPIEPRIMKKIFRNLIAKLKDASTDEIALEKMKNKGNESYLQYYEPFVAKETTENNNIEFNKKFVKYINSGLKSKELLKDMKYLPIGKTFLIYLELLSKKEDKELSTKLFDEFMLKYSKKYFEILARKHHFNQFLYYFNFDNHRKNIEQVKVYNFIIPSYFD